MNTSELAKILSNKYFFTQDLSDQVLKTILKSITTELKKGNRVRLRNFGTFEARKSHGKVRAKFDASKNLLK
jgi:nucleoid DNA-binding protein